MPNVTHEALATTKCLEHAPSRGVIDFEDGYCGKQMQQSFAEQCKVTMLVISMSCLASKQVNVRQLVETRHDDEALPFARMRICTHYLSLIHQAQMILLCWRTFARGRFWMGVWNVSRYVWDILAIQEGVPTEVGKNRNHSVPPLWFLVRTKVACTTFLIASELVHFHHMVT